MIKYLELVIGIIIFLLDLYYVFVSFGFMKKYCSKCKGYLARTDQYYDVYIGNKSGRIYKYYLNYMYTYRIDGKEYRISGGVPGIKNSMNQVVDIIYQKNNPKLAYINRLTIPFQPILAILLLPLWIILFI